MKAMWLLGLSKGVSNDRSVPEGILRRRMVDFI